MIWENLQLAFSSLLSNKMRALLTMLGIIIGIMSIITIVIIGDAMTATVSGNLATLGGNNIMLNLQEKSAEEPTESSAGDNRTELMQLAATARRSSGSRTPEPEDLITETMLTDIKTRFAGEAAGVSLSYSGGAAAVRDGELYANVSVTGANADYFLANNVTLLQGRLISDADVAEKSQAAVVSDRLVRKMFPVGSDPIGRQIKLYKSNTIEMYTVAGVYEYEQTGFFASTVAEEDISTVLYIPVSTAKQNLLEKNYTAATVISEAGADVQALTEAIQTYFDGLYAANTYFRVNVFNMSSILDTVSETLGTISVAIAFIAGISLVVGGIGVMNIMLVSVTERTREIGTRKALGAKNYHIQFQFVTEALIIALVGGVIGMLLGVALGAAAAAIFQARLVVSPLVVAGSVLFSMAIGVFFGLYPANKAAKLDPIEALRYE